MAILRQRAILIGGFAAIIVIAGMAGFFILSSRRAAPPTEAELKIAPQFSLKNYDGAEIKSSDFSGKSAVIISWASWCARLCRGELEELATLKKEFGDHIAVVAINRAEALEIARAYSDALGINNSVIFLSDPDDSFYKSIGGFSMPEAIFIDAAGKLKHHARWPMQEEEFRRRMEDLIRK